jgi:DNA polymerase (family 10)
VGRGPRISRELVEPIAREIHRALEPLSRRSMLCGSLRRGDPTVGDIDLVMVGPVDVAKIRGQLESLGYGCAEDVLNVGRPRKKFIVTRHDLPMGSLQLDVWIVPEGCFGAAILYCTGPGPFNTVMRRHARLRGLRLTLLGLDDGRMLLASRTEEDVFRAVGWRYLGPPGRSDWQTAVEPYLAEMDALDEKQA